MIVLRFTLAVCLLLASFSIARAQNRVDDGNFDGLITGTNPDCDAFAGAWWFPTAYRNAGLCEQSNNQITIVATDDFDDGASGESLALNVGSYTGSIVLPNIMVESIDRSENVTFDCMFDIWVPTSGLSGGAIFLGAGGFDSSTQRGPQIHWDPNGVANARVKKSNGQLVDVALLNPYPNAEWQRWFIRVDLQSYTFDAYYAPRDEQFTKVAAGVGFRSTKIDYVDRINIAYFGDRSNKAQSYFDNFTIFRDALGDMNCDGNVDFSDIDAFVTALVDRSEYESQYPTCKYLLGDINADGVVAFDDIDGFVNCILNDGCI